MIRRQAPYRGGSVFVFMVAGRKGGHGWVGCGLAARLAVVEKAKLPASDQQSQSESGLQDGSDGGPRQKKARSLWVRRSRHAAMPLAVPPYGIMQPRD